MVIGKGLEKAYLSDQEVIGLSTKGLSQINFTDKKVLTIIPDHTRTAPLHLFFRIIFDQLAGKVNKLDFLIALGTHPPMGKEQILNQVGISEKEKNEKYSSVHFFNHTWDDPQTLRTIGTISENKIAEVSNGLLKENVTVQINRMIFDYDLLIIIGPVFPHEVVGFSGGNKYFFPGIAGPEIVHFFHWLGALITNPVINGKKYTPVRKVIDIASSFINLPTLCFSLVIKDKKLSGLFMGEPREAWSRAADLSEKLNIVYTHKTYKKVIGIAPRMYDDLWTGGKVMYKLENVVQDGGELIIYAPHITEVSYTHGKILDKVGYHVRDYYLAQKDKFDWVPGGIKAHSTHVKGIGTFKNGVEKPRIDVTLATGIPEERCRKINLGYKDPQKINVSDWENKEDEGILLVPDAGETLYRVN